MPVGERVLIKSLLRRFEAEFHEHFHSPCPRARLLFLPKIVDLDPMSGCIAYDARQALKEEAPMDRLRSLIGDLQQVAQGLMARPSAPPPGADQGGPAGPAAEARTGAGQPGASDDDVIDAEFSPS